MSPYRDPHEPEVTCSFCGKSRREVRKIVAGDRVTICDECVQLSKEIVVEQELAAAPELVTPAEIAAHLDERVVGLGEAKRALVAALLARLARRTAGGRAPRILLVGPAGAGKTTLGRAVVSCVPKGGHATSAGRLSECAYIGDDVEHALRGLVDASGVAAQDGVLFLDDVDKLAEARPLGVGRDISGTRVQLELLRLLDGLEVDIPFASPPVRVATDAITVVAAVRAPWTAQPRELRAALRELGLVDAFLARFDRVLWIGPLGASERAAVLARAIGEANRFLTRVPSRLELSPAAADAIVALAADRGGWAIRGVVQTFVEAALFERPPIAYVDDAALRWFLGNV